MKFWTFFIIFKLLILKLQCGENIYRTVGGRIGNSGPQRHNILKQFIVVQNILYVVLLYPIVVYNFLFYYATEVTISLYYLLYDIRIVQQEAHNLPIACTLVN